MNKQSLKSVHQKKYAHARAKAATASGVKGQQGRQLESLLELTHIAYEKKGLASIIKQHPEITVTGMKERRITSGFYKEKGAPDYMGINSFGRPIIFDAKETTIRTSFPLKNLKQHQFDYLESWHKKGARSFLIVCFMKQAYETYLLPFDKLQPLWEGYTGAGSKSIPYSYFVENCDLVKSDGMYMLHYLKLLGKE